LSSAVGWRIALENIVFKVGGGLKSIFFFSKINSLSFSSIEKWVARTDEFNEFNEFCA
jgi:hypothetical protein